MNKEGDRMKKQNEDDGGITVHDDEMTASAFVWRFVWVHFFGDKRLNYAWTP